MPVTSAGYAALSLDLEAEVTSQIARVRSDPDLTLVVRARLLASLSTTLTNVGKLTGRTRELTDEQAVRLPSVQRCINRIIAALQPYPAAARAVRDEFAKQLEDRE